jgi:hypothetical protein
MLSARMVVRLYSVQVEAVAVTVPQVLSAE